MIPVLVSLILGFLIGMVVKAEQYRSRIKAELANCTFDESKSIAPEYATTVLRRLFGWS